MIFLKAHRENRNRVDPPMFNEAVDWFKQELENDTTIKLRSKEYRLMCASRRFKSN
jgi:mRNA-degrading endonuclease RelE of RelBE toxin-antitoxin system